MCPLVLLSALEPLALSAWGFVFVVGHLAAFQLFSHWVGIAHQKRSASLYSAAFILKSRQVP